MAKSRNLTKVPKKYLYMMGISCIIVVRPRAALGPFWGKKIFWSKIQFFQFFFLKIALIQPFLVAVIWNLVRFWSDHDPWVWRKKFLKIRDFWKKGLLRVGFSYLVRFGYLCFPEMNFYPHHHKAWTSKVWVLGKWFAATPVSLLWIFKNRFLDRNWNNFIKKNFPAQKIS